MLFPKVRVWNLLQERVNGENADSKSILLLETPQEQKQHNGIPEHLMCKNRLQEFCQRARIPFPVYYTFCEGGPQHAPIYKSTVEVDGEKYKCHNSFSSRKAAEQDVSKIALEGITEKFKNCVSKKTTEGGFPPVFQDKVFCKSILHEFAKKMNIDLPKYDTVKVEGVYPIFTSSLVFDGVKYSGQPGVNKKDAEQLAARAAILSILAKPGQGMQLSEIVKSKAKLFSVVHEHTTPSQPISGNPHETSVTRDSVGTNQASEVFENVVSEELQGQAHVPSKHTSAGDSTLQPIAGSPHKTSVTRDSARANQASEVIGNVVSEELQGQAHVPSKHIAGSPHKTSATGGSVGANQASEVIGNVVSEELQGQAHVPSKHTSAGDSPLQPIAGSPHKTSATGDSVGANHASEVIGNVVSEVHQGQSHVLPKHEFTKPGMETFTPAVPLLPITFVPLVEAQIPLDASACGKKRKSKKKKKANKKAKIVA